MLQGGVLDHLLQGGCKVFQNDDGDGARVFELVLQLIEQGCDGLVEFLSD